MTANQTLRLLDLQSLLSKELGNTTFSGSTRINEKSITLFFDGGTKSLTIGLEPVEMLDCSHEDVLTVTLGKRKIHFRLPVD